jgi:hypothetical protein
LALPFFNRLSLTEINEVADALASALAQLH